MEQKTILERTKGLFDEYTKFIESIKKVDTTKKEEFISVDTLIKMKSAFSNVNNIMTLLATRSVAAKLAKELALTDEDISELFKSIEDKSANSNGFDIQIDENLLRRDVKKILVEVKCNVLIHGQKYGAAQRKGIHKDAIKLRENNRGKIKLDRTGYLKLIVIVNFDQGSDSHKLIESLIKPATYQRTNNPDKTERNEVKLHMHQLESFSDIHSISGKDLDEVYVIALSKEDLSNELNVLINDL